jgi:hypothetical protein
MCVYVCVCVCTEDGANADTMDYTLKRLLRGVQSGRSGARQGFSLALTHILVNMPSVTTQVRRQTL